MTLTEEQKKALGILGQLSGCGTTDDDVDVIVQALRQASEMAARACIESAESVNLYADGLGDVDTRDENQKCHDSGVLQVVDAVHSAAAPFMNRKSE